MPGGRKQFGKEGVIMETEYKYSIENSSVFDLIVENAEINRMGLDAVESIDMHAVYFDTEDLDFRSRGIAYRIRQEDERCTATIKWDVNVKEGLHQREEFNLVVNDERFAQHPDIGIFVSSDAYDVLYEAAGDKPLMPTVTMDYQRRQFKVDTGRSISCISVDEGVIHHLDGHVVPVCELEIEWYYGDEADFMELAGLIQTVYGLRSENKSKLQRAFE